MLRQVISDSIWQQLQITMSKKAVGNQKITAMLWKPSYGNFEQGLPGEIYLTVFVLGKQLITGLIVGHKKVFGMIFFCSTKRN